MSNFRYQLQAEIDELKELGKSETNVVNFENSKEDELTSDSLMKKNWVMKIFGTRFIQDNIGHFGDDRNPWLDKSLSKKVYEWKNLAVDIPYKSRNKLLTCIKVSQLRIALET